MKNLQKVIDVAAFQAAVIGRAALVAAAICMATAAGLYVLALATTTLSLVGLEVFGILLFRDRRRARRNSDTSKSV